MKVTDDELFRLCSLKRPVAAIDCDLFGLEWRIKAISSRVIDGFLAETKSLERAAGLRAYRSMIVAAVLETSDGDGFGSHSELSKALTDREWLHLSSIVLNSLEETFPMYNLSDPGPTMVRMMAGAAHGSNLNTTFLMAATEGAPWVYYGIPPVDLVDCQLIAYNAAVKYVKDMNSGE